jgi:hypothetical protein
LWRLPAPDKDVRNQAQEQGRMSEPAYPVTQHDYADDAAELDRLESALEGGPKGALAVSLIAVGLLMIGWLGIYFLVFLPRGTVG